MSNGTPIGVVHRASPEEGLKILRRVTIECKGIAEAIAKELGLSVPSIRRYQAIHPELRKLAKDCQMKAAKAELAELAER